MLTGFSLVSVNVILNANNSRNQKFFANCKIAIQNKQTVTVAGHCHAYACVVRVNQPLLVQCFILVIPGFSISAFNFQYSGF